MAEIVWHTFREARNRSSLTFGSRATGKALKRFSDLDLAVEGRLTSSEDADLSEAFEEFLLPFKE